MERKIIYSDPSFEEITKNEIEQAQAAMQHVVDVWHSLKLPALTTKSELYDLLSNTDLVINEARAAKTRTTSDVNIPVPSQLPVDFGALYRAVSAANGQPYCERQYSLFNLKGKKVTIEQEQADTYINARTLYADTEEQEDFYNDYESFLRFFNRVNELQGGSLLASLRHREAWNRLMVMPPEGYNSYPGQMRTELLRELLPMV